jgi:hypothetical protein
VDMGSIAMAMFAYLLARRYVLRGENVPLADARGDVLSSTVMLRDSSGGSFRLALPAVTDPSLGVAMAELVLTISSLV